MMMYTMMMYTTSTLTSTPENQFDKTMRIAASKILVILNRS